MLSSQSGVSEVPKPGWSGTITSKCRDSRSMNGIQAETPSAPCRYNSGAPCPPRMILILQPLTVSNVSRCAILFVPARETRQLGSQRPILNELACLRNHVRDRRLVVRRHHMRARDARHFGKLRDEVDADLLALGRRIAGVFEPLHDVVGNDRAVKLLLDPARRAARAQ